MLDINISQGAKPRFLWSFRNQFFHRGRTHSIRRRSCPAAIPLNTHHSDSWLLAESREFSLSISFKSPSSRKYVREIHLPAVVPRRRVRMEKKLFALDGYSTSKRPRQLHAVHRPRQSRTLRFSVRFRANNFKFAPSSGWILPNRRFCQMQTCCDVLPRTCYRAPKNQASG